MTTVAAYLMLALVVCVYAQALFRPGAAVAVALLVFALEQAVRAGVTAFAVQQSLWNIATGVGFVVVLMALILTGKYRFRGAFRPVVVAALAFLGYFIWAASWGWAETPQNLLTTLAPYIAVQIIIVPLLLQSLPDAVQAFRWTMLLGAAVLLFIVAVPDALYDGGRLMFRVAEDPDKGTNPMALADAAAFVFLTLALRTPGIFAWLRGGLRWAAMGGALLVIGLASRGELVAAVVAGLATLLLAPMRRRGWVTVVLLVGLSAAVLSVVVDTFVASRYEQESVTRDMTSRVEMSARMIELYLARPEAWFRGLGTGHSSIVIGAYPHNQVVQMFTEGGLIGAVLWLALHGSAAWIGITHLRGSAEDNNSQFVMRCAVAFWIYYLVVGLKRGHVLDVYGIAAPVLVERCALLVSDWKRTAHEREGLSDAEPATTGPAGTAAISTHPGSRTGRPPVALQSRSRSIGIS